VISVNDGAALSAAIHEVKTELLRIRTRSLQIGKSPRSAHLEGEEKTLLAHFERIVSSAESIVTASTEYGSTIGSERAPSPVNFDPESAARTSAWVQMEPIDLRSTKEQFERDHVSRYATIAEEHCAKQSYSRAKTFYAKFLRGIEAYKD
jgi:hypothetical protein